MLTRLIILEFVLCFSVNASFKVLISEPKTEKQQSLTFFKNETLVIIKTAG